MQEDRDLTELQKDVPAEAVVTEDPDAPVITEGGESETAEAAQEVATEDETAEHELNREQTQQLVSEAAVMEDPDAPVGLEATGTTLATDVEVAGNEENGPENTGDGLSGPDETAETSANADNVAAGDQIREEVSAEQLLMSAEQPKSDQTEPERLALLEAIVYVTDEPLSLQQIAKALGQTETEVRPLLDKLVEEYNQTWHGLTVKEVAGGYKIATKPEHHEAVRTVVKNLNPPLKLSLAALETLAVIAYKQPITAPEIMEIRGVQGAGVLKTLIDRKLITTAGRKNVVGKPILYKTTREFLVQFGLRDLNELPTLKEFEDLRRMAFSDQDPEPEATAPEANTEEATADEAAVQQPVE